MKADKIRQIEGAELPKKVTEAREQMFRIRFQMTMGQVDGLKKYRELKKDRARMLTIEREAQLASAKAAGKKG